MGEANLRIVRLGDWGAEGIGEEAVGHGLNKHELHGSLEFILGGRGAVGVICLQFGNDGVKGVNTKVCQATGSGWLDFTTKLILQAQLDALAERKGARIVGVNWVARPNVVLGDVLAGQNFEFLGLFWGVHAVQGSLPDIRNRATTLSCNMTPSQIESSVSTFSTKELCSETLALGALFHQVNGDFALLVNGLVLGKSVAEELGAFAINTTRASVHGRIVFGHLNDPVRNTEDPVRNTEEHNG